MQRRRSCGVFVLRVGETPAVLLLRDADGWDVPKGKDKRGERELQCAVRELYEETGIAPEHVSIEPSFRFEAVLRKRNRQGDVVEKTLVMFLGLVEQDAHVRCDDHDGFTWIPYEPGLTVGDALVDQLLRAVDEHLGTAPRRKRAG